MNWFKTKMEREAHRYLCGWQMICVACESILDMDTAGSIEVTDEKGDHVSLRALCPRCYPRAKAITEQKIAEKAEHFGSAEFYTVADGTTTAKRDKATQLPIFGGDQ
tara:strand:+ start:1261 stop:1581 length:321 start_codon:yes stop_codon:yes gene_type:complete